ncbi:MAG: TIGR04283 family arsenosugar biosynthesis glycosyltransferase [Pseudomonadota bacterium]
MPAPISVIIPTLNAEAHLSACLAHLYEGVSEGLIKEVLLADGGSTDDTQTIAREWGAEIIDCPKGRGTQLAHAIQQASGEWYFVVHADTRIQGDWPAIIRVHLNSSKLAGYGKLRFDTSGLGPFVTASWANFRSRFFGLPYGDQTLLISRQLYRQIGGYSEIPLMEDVDIARKLRGKKCALHFIALTDSKKYATVGWFRRGAKNLYILMLYTLGRDPEALAKLY